jgi:hypothetical protein
MQTIRKVSFVSQAKAEKLQPIPGAAMISLTDPDKPVPDLKGWDNLYRENFYDAGYSESLIHTFKDAFRANCASYIDSGQADRLSTHIDNLVAQGVNEIYVHCYFGVSRSGAVAMYLQDKHHFTTNKPVERPNQTVYDLLNNPFKHESLIRSYEQSQDETESSFLSKAWALFLIAIGVKK